MTDALDTAPDQAPEPADATVKVADLVALMDSVRHDVVGQCWQLWTGIEALVKAAI